jgi:zinc resistance-associated protein
MWKTVLVGTTALAIACTTFAYAQPSQDELQLMQRWHLSAADVIAFAEARIAALHAGLQLTPDQEKKWPAVESAMKELAKQRSARFAARANGEPSNTPIERLERRAQMLSDRGAALKKLADAAGPLYDSLTPDQKYRFMVLARFGGRRFALWRMHHGWLGQEWDGWHHWRPRDLQGGPMPQ